MKKLAVRSFFTVGLAVMMSMLLVVTPAHADLWDDYATQNKIPAAERHNYSYDYIKRSYVPNELYYQTGQTARPINQTIHPATTGSTSSGSYYKPPGTISPNPANVPISGKIIEPGKTLVRAPSTYAPAVGTAFKFGIGKILGTAGLGIGGTSLAPANADQVALNQGVSGGCVTNNVCTAEEINKRMLISSCANLTGAQSCSSIGATGFQGETDLQKWFRTDALGLLDDLWGKITGQRSGAPASDTHIQINPRGCLNTAAVQYLPETGKIILHSKITVVNPRPGSNAITLQQWWDSSCTAASGAKFSNLGGTQFKSVCVGTDPGHLASYGKTTSFGTIDLGRNGGIDASQFETVNGNFQSRSGLCNGTTGNPKPIALKIFNTSTQAQHDASPSQYGALNYTEWLNPDPGMDTIEDTTITTTWDCASSNGTIYTFTKSLGKTAAIVSPDCPPGSTLVKHDIKAKTGLGPSTTLDAGQSVPAEMAKYPACTTAGCAMTVNVDGQPCTVGRPECQTWPQINATQPSRVGCQWGTYTVPTSDCVVLQDGYKSESGVVFDPNSGTWVAIDVYGNPIASNPQPWNPANPAPTPGVSAGTTPTTGTTTPGSTFPGSGTNPSDNCVAPSWSWNPVEWVKNPVVCALDAAFVPKTDIAARMGELQTLTADKPPLSWLNMPMVGPGGGGCPNWVVSLPGLERNVVCESSFTAAIVGSRGALFGLVATAMVWPLMRSIWYAAIPVLRVSPGSSK